MPIVSRKPVHAARIGSSATAQVGPQATGSPPFGQAPAVMQHAAST
jgi:hypothetical protein